MSHMINIEGTGGDAIAYLGYVEAHLCLPIGKKIFETDAL